MVCLGKDVCASRPDLSLQVLGLCSDGITLGPQITDCSRLESHISHSILILSPELGLHGGTHASPGMQLQYAQAS